MTKLGGKAKYCLKILRDHGAMSTWDVCKRAIEDGMQDRRQSYEWADAPFRQLRGLGFIGLTGQMDETRRRIHAITPKGVKFMEDSAND